VYLAAERKNKDEIQGFFAALRNDFKRKEDDDVKGMKMTASEGSKMTTSEGRKMTTSWEGRRRPRRREDVIAEEEMSTAVSHAL
jgi:hypothetical protein